MQKNMTQLKCTINGKEIIFSCETECNTIEIKEALCQFIKYVGNIEDTHKAKLKEEQDSKVEDLDQFEEAKVETIEA